MKNIVGVVLLIVALLYSTLTWALDPADAGLLNLHTFNDNGKDGAYPFEGVILGANGNLYGTTGSGGIYYGGTVFELSPNAGGGWTEKILHDFELGVGPYGSLIFDTSGNLYGTTVSGGALHTGTVFELTPTTDGNWKETSLHDFGNGKDGRSPYAGLVFDAAGNLYGTTPFGGVYGYGTVFELTPASGGGWSEKVLHSFNNDGVDGLSSYASLVIDGAGSLYGTTSVGGAYNQGTVFELSPSVSGGWTENVLHNFDLTGNDGNNPYSTLIFDAAGNLYWHDRRRRGCWRRYGIRVDAHDGWQLE